MKYWAPQYSNLSKMPTKDDKKILWMSAGTDAIKEDEVMEMNEKVSDSPLPNDGNGNFRDEL